MNDTEFVSLRHNFRKTQKQMAELLGISLRSVQSFEQGWRKIPTNIERQILYLVCMRKTQEESAKPCWEVEDCPPERRCQCPAWEFNTGQLCWFINGTICQGKPHRNWEEKIEFCRKCEVFQSVRSLLEDTLSEFHTINDD